jgi:sodium pump decarboxylase gamma subunit
MNKDTEDAVLVVGLCEKWLAAKEIAGDYVGVVEDSFTLTKSGKTVTTAQTLKFSEREVTFELVYNYFDMKMTGSTIEPVYSIGEKMEKAALNTVICMSIVFVVLILISLIISCFKIFPYLEKRKAEKAKAKIKEVPSVTVPEANVETPQLTDDTELVAVIAAAIAASTGTSTSDFVVRSIRRR